MICRSKKIRDILNKIFQKQKQLDGSKDLSERAFLRKELKDLRLILRVFVNDYE